MRVARGLSILLDRGCNLVSRKQFTIFSLEPLYFCFILESRQDSCSRKDGYTYSLVGLGVEIAFSFDLSFDAFKSWLSLVNYILQTLGPPLWVRKMLVESIVAYLPAEIFGANSRSEYALS